MAKKELEEQLKYYEGYINDIPLVIDPCKQCKNVERKNEEQIEKCRLCCWYYTSSFEIISEAEGKDTEKENLRCMGKIDPENYDYISARQYHERYEDTK